jgi:hypothetical protein
MCGRRIGHAVRDSSPDRRVYTSPLGHAVPPELIRELSRKLRHGLKKQLGKKLDRAANDLEEEPAKAEREEAWLAERPEDEDRTEKTAKTEERSAKKTWSRRQASLFREVAHSLLWALLLSTLGGAVAWGVYLGLRRAAPAEASSQPYPHSSTSAAGPAGLSKTGGGRAAAGSASRARSPARSDPSGGPSSSGVLDEKPQLESPALVVPVVPRSASVVAPPVAAAALPTTAPPMTQVSDREAAPSASHDDLDFVASAHSPQVRACYDRAFRHAGTQAPAGRVELSFTLTDSGDAGRAVDIVTELNLLGNPTVATCLEELVAEWRFPRPPPPPPGGPRRLRYPFVFTAASP